MAAEQVMNSPGASLGLCTLHNCGDFPDVGVEPSRPEADALPELRTIIRAPAAITLFTLRMSEISRSGRPATTIRSARLPASIVPTSRSSFIARAGTIVADLIARKLEPSYSVAASNSSTKPSGSTT